MLLSAPRGFKRGSAVVGGTSLVARRPAFDVDLLAAATLDLRAETWTFLRRPRLTFGPKKSVIGVSSGLRERLKWRLFKHTDRVSRPLNYRSYQIETITGRGLKGPEKKEKDLSIFVRMASPMLTAMKQENRNVQESPACEISL